MQPLHAIVLGSCEKAGRHDAAPHGCGMEPRKRGTVWRGGVFIKKKKKIPTVPVSCDQGSRLSWNHGNVSHWWGIFFTAIAAVNQAGQGEMAATHAMPLLKGGGGEEQWQNAARKNKQSWATFLSFGIEIRSSEIPEHISFTHVVLKRWLVRGGGGGGGGEAGLKSNPSLILLLIFRAWSSKAIQPRSPFPLPSLGSPRGRALHTSAVAGLMSGAGHNGVLALWCMFLRGGGPCGPSRWAGEGLSITGGLTSCVKLRPARLQLW